LDELFSSLDIVE